MKSLGVVMTSTRGKPQSRVAMTSMRATAGDVPRPAVRAPLLTGPVLYFSEQIQEWLSYKTVSFPGSAWCPRSWRRFCSFMQEVHFRCWLAGLPFCLVIVEEPRAQPLVDSIMTREGAWL